MNNYQKWGYVITGIIAAIILLLIAKRTHEAQAKASSSSPGYPGLQQGGIQPGSPAWNVITYGGKGLPMANMQTVGLPNIQLRVALNDPYVGMGNGWDGALGYGGNTSIYMPLFGFVGYTDYAMY